MSERPADDEYDWPCSRHEAHAPHPVKMYDTLDGDWIRQCPGVKAHPNTMIGRNDVPLLKGGKR